MAQPRYTSSGKSEAPFLVQPPEVLDHRRKFPGGRQLFPAVVEPALRTENASRSPTNEP